MLGCVFPASLHGQIAQRAEMMKNVFAIMASALTGVCFAIDNGGATGKASTGKASTATGKASTGKASTATGKASTGKASTATAKNELQVVALCPLSIKAGLFESLEAMRAAMRRIHGALSDTSAIVRTALDSAASPEMRKHAGEALISLSRGVYKDPVRKVTESGNFQAVANLLRDGILDIAHIKSVTAWPALDSTTMGAAWSAWVSVAGKEGTPVIQYTTGKNGVLLHASKTKVETAELHMVECNGMAFCVAIPPEVSADDADSENKILADCKALRLRCEKTAPMLLFACSDILTK